jgi:hypothetical protein
MWAPKIICHKGTQRTQKDKRGKHGGLHLLTALCHDSSHIFASALYAANDTKPRWRRHPPGRRTNPLAAVIFQNWFDPVGLGWTGFCMV